jgi:hypothetical protein
LKLTPHNFREAEYRRSSYLVTADRGTEIADLTGRDYWSHVAARLRPRDRVEVHADDGSWMVEMMVVQASRVGATLVILHKHDLTVDLAVDASTDDNVEIKYRGPSAKWSAIRKSDKAVIVEQLESKAEVAAWLKKPQQQAQAA